MNTIGNVISKTTFKMYILEGLEDVTYFKVDAAKARDSSLGFSAYVAESVKRAFPGIAEDFVVIDRSYLSEGIDYRVHTLPFIHCDRLGAAWKDYDQVIHIFPSLDDKIAIARSLDFLLNS